MIISTTSMVVVIDRLVFIAYTYNTVITVMSVAVAAYLARVQAAFI